ncbi:hypothetical protein CPB86DRAFT_211985 [Serendipita vermifera]|nr:hypothetical protein CPB86DRAFT_211985 [Serendipita vermifera]
MDITPNLLVTPTNTVVGSPFYKYRSMGRCPSPPVWGCYELNCNDMNIPLPPSPVTVVTPMESEQDATAPAPQDPASAVTNDSSADAALGDDAQKSPSPEVTQENQESSDENCGDYARPKLDKGKGREVLVDLPPTPVPVTLEQCTPSTPSSRMTRRSARTRQRTPKFQPILTIRSSHGWVWNQDLFVPHYMKDRYTSYPPDQPSTDGPNVEYDCIGITLTQEDLTIVVPP